MSGPELKEALQTAGASRDEIASATRFVENAVAHQFEREVQDHVIEKFEGLVQDLDRARTGQGPEFETRLRQLSGTGGPRLMRVMQGMGIDTSELSALTREWGGANVDRDAVMQRMRGPLQTALQEMHEVATEQLDDAQGTVFRDETYSEYSGAADAVAREWGLPRGAIRRPTGAGSSVVGHALQRRHREATDSSMEEAARGLPGGGVLFKLATMVVDYAQSDTAATREATMAEVGEGDPGEAIEGRARAVADVGLGLGEIVVGHVAGEVTEHLEEHAVEGANRLVDAATGTARNVTGSPDVARDGLAEGVRRGVGALMDAGQEAFTDFLEHQDTPVPHKATNL